MLIQTTKHNAGQRLWSERAIRRRPRALRFNLTAEARNNRNNYDSLAGVFTGDDKYNDLGRS